MFLSSFLPDSAVPWLVMIGAGAYHGLNPGMGWLFALSVGLQQRSAKAIWTSALPLAVGHTLAVAVVALLLVGGIRFLSTGTLQLLTAIALLGFGGYKIITYYRRPEANGCPMRRSNLMWWSFVMAMAHGAGLLVAPALLGISAICGSGHGQLTLGAGLSLGIALHTLAMLGVTVGLAWLAYARFGSAIGQRRWLNFDLIWGIALLGVGLLALPDGGLLL